MVSDDEEDPTLDLLVQLEGSIRIHVDMAEHPAPNALEPDAEFFP